MTQDFQKTHLRTAQTGMALSVTLAALATIFIAAMTNLRRIAGAAGGIDAPEPVAWGWVASVTILPLVICFFAFARTAGCLGAPERLGRTEALVYKGLVGACLAALLVRAGTVGLETTLLVVALPPVLLFVAVRQNRAAGRMGDGLTSLEAERALP